jgi:hypothetical protein
MTNQEGGRKEGEGRKEGKGKKDEMKSEERWNYCERNEGRRGEDGRRKQTTQKVDIVFTRADLFVCLWLFGKLGSGKWEVVLDLDGRNWVGSRMGVFVIYSGFRDFRRTLVR